MAGHVTARPSCSWRLSADHVRSPPARVRYHNNRYYDPAASATDARDLSLTHTGPLVHSENNLSYFRETLFA